MRLLLIKPAIHRYDACADFKIGEGGVVSAIYRAVY